MRRRPARRSSLLLFELILSILMFSVTSAWCVRLFAAAGLVTEETGQQDHARNLAVGYAELFLASEDFDAFLLDEGAKKEERADKTSYRLWYNGNWQTCREEAAAFCFEAVVTQTGDFGKCSFSFTRIKEGESELIHLLDVEKYVGGEAV